MQLLKELDLIKISLARKRGKNKRRSVEKINLVEYFSMSPCPFVEHGNWANCPQSLQLELGIQKQLSLLPCFLGETLKVSKDLELSSAMHHMLAWNAKVAAA